MHGKIKHIKQWQDTTSQSKKMKFINQSYGQAYTKSSNHDTCKIKTK
jgi:hypothetical protein